MTDVHRIALSNRDESAHLRRENDKDSSLAVASTEMKAKGSNSFVVQLIEAHRYVNNRRTASMYN